jgi:transcriptional regulator GlxA family with amidase domain
VSILTKKRSILTIDAMERVLVEILRPPGAVESCVASWRDLFRLCDNERARAGFPPRWSVIESRDPGAITPRARGGRVLLIPAFWECPDIRESGRWVRLIRRRLNAGFTVGSVCAGAFLLAEAGVFRGLSATTHWSLAEEFHRRYPGVDLAAEEMLLDHGKIVLGAGMTAYFDLGLHLVARFEGEAVARRCARTLLLEPGRKRQSPYSERAARLQGDEVLQRAEAWLDSHWASCFMIGDWALGIGVEKRTLNRRYRTYRSMSPWEAVVSRRLEHARFLLETGSQPWASITAACAYDDPVSFRRSFVKRFGIGPREYRERFGGQFKTFSKRA